MGTTMWGKQYEWTTGETDTNSSPNLGMFSSFATMDEYSTPGVLKHSIGVDKGRPDKAKYAIFYAVQEDPVIFCSTYKEMKKEVAKLRRRGDVIQSSIRVFKLIGGVKRVKRGKAR